ncbi:S1/P1 Nuclease [Geosmithia morbida]|uniref:S1/P1 Nuclease n=1 Tax=Geosmithia morbida TaxID=1094350 RepID=A0A9P4YZK8_9HYPO|nr:S1/P1 Nuclease [Geosmithia morbida]KAF4124661.1 S1/P1 Nuclease [Geosmithia morbida]
MRLSTLTAGLLPISGVAAWGSLGHMTTAFVASQFVDNATEAFFQDLLGNDQPDYLAGVASWADSIRYTRWGRFTKNFHFIDAHDSPPDRCDVDFQRDCKDESGCVVSALANYTSQSVDTALPAWLRAQAAKFVIHFVGDLHQPLHNEDVALGGNRIYVRWDGRRYNLHHVWDTSIAEKWIGGLHGKPLPLARRWAEELSREIRDGKFSDDSRDLWLKDLDFGDAVSTAMAWSRECNAYVCSHVFPEGPAVIAGQELGGDYYEAAGPVIEKQIARAGFRMAAWLDAIAAEYARRSESNRFIGTDEMEL